MAEDILLQVEAADIDEAVIAYTGKSIPSDHVQVDVTDFTDDTLTDQQLVAKKVDELQTEALNLKFSTAGIYAIPTYHDNGNGTITVGDGQYVLFINRTTNPPQLFPIAGGTFSCTDLVNNYLVADYNSGTPVVRISTSRSDIDQILVIPIFTIFRNGNTLVKVDWDELTVGLANKMNDRLVRTSRFANEPGGLALGEAATRLVTITEGYVWTGAIRSHIDAFNSGINDLVFYKHVASSWVESIITQYNNSQYDNGTALATLSDNRYAVNWIFRRVNADSTKAYLVLGSGDYKLNEAQESKIPSDLPMEIQSTGILVGRIIVKKGVDTAYQIDSAFEQVLAIAPVNDHSKLTNLEFENSGHTGFQAELTNPVTGSGTANYIPKKTGATTVADSQIYDNGSLIGMGLIGVYQYMAISHTADTAGDIRYKNLGGAMYTETCSVGNATKGAGTWVVTEFKVTKSLLDSNELEGAGSYIDLASGKSGIAKIVVGNNEEEAYFGFDTNAVVSLQMCSGNVFISLQTGTNHLVIKDNGTNVRITNELGSTKNITLVVNYNN